MTARAFIFISVFLLSACATNQSPISQLPKVQMEGNRLVEPEYGYSVQIPDGWKQLDQNYVERLPPSSRKQMNEVLDRLVADRSFRACFVETSGRTGVTIRAAETAFETRGDLITYWRENSQGVLTAENDFYGFERFYNLEFNRFKNLTDLNSTYESTDGRRTVSYVHTYSFKQSLYVIELDFGATHADFDSYLPLYYECVNSLSVPGRSASPQEQKSNKSVNQFSPLLQAPTMEKVKDAPVDKTSRKQGDTETEQKLIELKRLLNKGLINQEDYDRKKAELLDQL